MRGSIPEASLYVWGSIPEVRYVFQFFILFHFASQPFQFVFRDRAIAISLPYVLSIFASRIQHSQDLRCLAGLLDVVASPDSARHAFVVVNNGIDLGGQIVVVRMTAHETRPRTHQHTYKQRDHLARLLQIVLRSNCTNMMYAYAYVR